MALDRPEQFAPGAVSSPRKPNKNATSTRYQCVRNNRRAKHYEFTGFGATYVTKQYKCAWSGDIHGLKPFDVLGSLAAILSHTPASGRRNGGHAAEIYFCVSQPGLQGQRPHRRLGCKLNHPTGKPSKQGFGPGQSISRPATYLVNVALHSEEGL